jgi:SAM-dependent methyltransferase
MTSETVHTLVAKQFGPRAAAYVQSRVHAHGEDLNELAALAQALKFARALDLGCGGGHVGFALAPHVGDIVAYDLSEAMLAAVVAEATARGISNLVTRQGTVEALPFEDASFDFVATRYSAHHWHDVPRALGEARRVLKPGGRALFMDVIAPEAPLLDTFLQTVELLRDPSHVRDYSVREWTAMLRAAGFTPCEPARASGLRKLDRTDGDTQAPGRRDPGADGANARRGRRPFRHRPRRQLHHRHDEYGGDGLGLGAPSHPS